MSMPHISGKESHVLCVCALRTGFSRKTLLVNGKAWEVSKVEAAAEAILQRDRFDRNLIDSDEEKTMRQ